MKRLLCVATMILLVTAGADQTLAQSAVHSRNPYAPLEKTADLKSAEPNDEAPPTSKSEVPLASEVFTLNFAKARDLEKTIGNLVSRDGKVARDDRLNSIAVIDTTANLERVKHVLEKLDVEAAQVVIDVLILNVQLTAELKMGVDWTKLGTSKASFGQGLSATGSANPFAKVSFSTTSGDWSIEGLIDFVATHKNVKILANPKVLVLNNHTATIDSVEEIPYQEQRNSDLGGGYASTSFKEAGVKLEVTPQIAADGHITMEVKPQQSVRIGTFRVGGNDTPIIETRRASTMLHVKDGQTIIIAGLRKKQPTMEESKVPILGDIPLIGVLFRKVDREQVESELGVFITPHIYAEGKASAEESELLRGSDTSQSLFEASDLLRLKADKNEACDRCR